MQPRFPTARIQGALLVLLTFAVYAPALFHGFVWDDYTHLLLNGLIPQPDGLERIWFHLSFQQYQPLQLTTHWLEYRIWGFDPLGYHAVNIVLHAGVGLLLWRVLLRLELPCAWLCAAVFLVHPVNAETAGYITERRNLISGACYLGAILFWFRFEEHEEKRWYAAALALFFLGLFAKTVICTLPAILLLLRWMRGKPLRLRDIVYVIPFGIVALPLALLTAFMENYLIGAHGYEWAFTFSQRVIICCHALWFYAWKILYPVNLMFFYPRWNVDGSDWMQWLYVGGAALVGLSLIPLTRRFGRRPAAALLYFAITLFPALGFATFYPQRFSFVADHFQYLATIGIIVLAVGVLHAFYLKLLAESDSLRSSQKFPLFANAALPLLLSTLLLLYLPALNNDDTVYADILSKNNDCWIAHTNVAAKLYQRGDFARSTRHLEEAHRIVPHELEVMQNLGESYEKQGRIDEARAIFETGISESPAEEMIANARERENIIAGKGFLNVYEMHRIEATLAMHLDLARLDQRANRRDSARAHLAKAEALRPTSIKPVLAHAEMLATDGHLDAALAECDRAAQINLSSAQPLVTKAELYVRYSGSGRLTDSFEKAEAAYRAALTRDPGHVQALTGLCEILIMQQKFDESASVARQGLAASKDNASLNIVLARALQAKGDFAGAAKAYNAALEIEPKNIKALSGFANLCLQGNQDKLAETMLRQVLELNPNSAVDRENLGVALARQGRYEEAIPIIQECRAIAPSLALDLNLKHLFLKTGRYAEAIALLETRLAQSNNPAEKSRVTRDLAFLLVAAPDEKIRNGTKGISLSQDLLNSAGGPDAQSADAADALHVMAAAQAEGGDFDAAVKTSQQAYAKAIAAKQPALAQEIAEHQKFYEAKKPYRLP